MKQHELEVLAKEILQEAKKQGAEQAEVGIGTNHGFSVTAHAGDVETVEYNQDKVIDVTVYIDKRRGSASLSDTRKEAVNAAVAAACHIAKFTDVDPAAGLAEKDELAFNYPSLKLAYPWNVSVEQAIEMACQLESEAKAYDKRIMCAESASVATANSWHLYANSLGFLGFFPYTRHELSCILVAKDGDSMQRDYSYSVSVDPTQLNSISKIAEEAAKRTVNRLGAKRLRTQKTPVIYIAEEARGLLGHFAGAIQGGSLYRKSSFLLDHLDKQVFPTFVKMYEQPFLDGGLGSAPFDNDGVATRNNVFVEEGVLRSYSLGIYSARKLGMKSTGNAGGMHNLTIETGSKDLAALLKTMNKGLLVTEMMGNGVNLITGDYSRGVGGYWVDHGEIQYPVQEITVAGKLQDMYAHMVEIGNDVDVRGNIRTGSILIDEVMIAGE